MSKSYQWDGSIVSSKGLSLVARAWARWCPLKTKIRMAEDPVKSLAKMNTLVSLLMAGIVYNSAINAIAYLIMNNSGLSVLIGAPCIAFTVGLAHVMSGSPVVDPNHKKTVFDSLYGGDDKNESRPELGGCIHFVWQLEVVSQIVGDRNRARLQQMSMLEKCPAADPDLAPQSRRL